MRYKMMAAVIGCLWSVLCLPVMASKEGVTLDAVQSAVNSFDATTVEKLITTDAGGIADDTVDAVIAIDESKAVNEASKRMLGVHYSAEGSDIPTMVDAFSEKPNATYLALADGLYHIPVSRAVIWGNIVNSIMPVNQRTPSAILKDIGYERYKPDADFDTAIGEGRSLNPASVILGTLAANPEAEFIFCVDIATSYPEDTANFVRFCLDENGSSEWAALRALWGIDKPVKLIGLEMGNELYFTSTPTPELEESATQWYIETFRKHADAVHKLYPAVEIMPTINFNSTRGGFYEWNTPVLRELGPEINLIVVHLYYSGYELAYTNKWVEDTRSLINDVVGSDNHIKFAMTEHAKWDTGSYVTRQALSGILPIAQFLNRMIPKDYFYCANNHGITGAAWGYIRKQDDGTTQLTGLNTLYRVYEENLGDRVLAANVESNSALTDINSSGQRFSVLVTPKGDKEIKIFLCNREEYTDFNLTFQYNNSYTLKSETVFTAPNSYSMVYSKSTKDIFTVTTTEKNEKNFTAYKMPTKSLVVLTLESDKALPALNQEENTGETETYEGEKVFQDIAGYWAENEIYFLREAGVINGVSDSVFEPDREMTRAEFATLLYRVISPAQASADFQISDVPDEAWFAEAVKALVSLGVVRLEQGRFRPNDRITLLDCAKFIYRADNTLTKSGADYSKYYNSQSLSAWERDILNFGIETGILKYFYETNRLEPAKNVTRGEAASLIYKVYKNSGLSQ